MSELTTVIANALRSFEEFTEKTTGIQLRSYQREAATAIVESVIRNKGYSFVIIFPRQSGKNELQAQIEAYLMALYQTFEKELVKVSPTWKPQSLNAMRRLERTLSRNLLLRSRWKKESGFIYRVGSTREYFFSGQPSANIVGATASLLLQCDEAQDVQTGKWDKEVNPMAAATNATRVFWGTAWTSNTLLAREKRAALDLEKEDGVRRVFETDANLVRDEVPSYGLFVDQEIAKLGRNHPFVKSQYFSEEIDAEGGMFPPDRKELMKGSHRYLPAPEEERLYAFLIDVAGQDEAATIDVDLDRIDLVNQERDAHALTIVEVDLSSLDEELIQGPTYLVRYRKLWFGTAHSYIFSRIKSLVELWSPAYIVIDATGIGAGLSSFFERAFPNITVPFIFNSATKSTLGWNFIATIETGRFKDHDPDRRSPEQSEFWLQVNHCLMEINPGPNRTMKWGVPDGTRDLATGDVIHDDLVVSAALCSVLDDFDWGYASSEIVSEDPLSDLQEVF